MNNFASVDVTSTELQRRSCIRTIALMHELMRRTKSANTNQFAKWFDSATAHWSRPLKIEPQRPGTEGNKRWYRIVRGEQAITEPGLEELQRLFPDAIRYFEEGPDRLWEAMWGDVDSLWSICGAVVHAFEVPDAVRKTDKSSLADSLTFELLAGPALSFDESLYNFECSLLSRKQQGEEISLRDLADSIALYRLHTAVSRLCKADGVGAYRCVRLCLENERIAATLQALRAHRASIDIYAAVSTDLTNMELWRLRAEPTYRESVRGADFAAHALCPAASRSDEARMELLKIG
jgi:hypothetical protein